MTQYERSGIVIAICGFAILSVGDAVVKSMADEWPSFAVAALRFSIGALVLSLILWRYEGGGGFIPQNLPLQIARGACVALASVCFFAAIYIMPLAEAMAISFLAPIFTQIFAGLLIGEEIKPKVYGLSLFALVGVAIILRPNLAELGWAAFLPLISAIFFALLMVGNRASAGQGSGLSMQFFVAGFCAPILLVFSFAAKLSGIAALDYDWPSLSVVARCIFVAFTASIAHWFAYIGISRAGAAMAAPAIYVQLIVAVTLGWIFFEEKPDVWTFVGAALIIMAGVLIWRDDMKHQPDTAEMS